MARIVARPYKYMRSPMIAKIIRNERRIDPITGFPVIRMNAIQTSKGWMDFRIHLPDVNPKTGAPES